MNPRSSYIFDTREVGRAPGSYRDYRRDVLAPTQLRLEMIGVPEGSSLVLNVRLESVTEGVLATGTATGPLVGECGRCLEEFGAEFDVDFMELFAYPDSLTGQTSDSEEVARLQRDRLDLQSVVRDAVALSLPLTPLCAPDCSGLCVDCGMRIDDLPPDHSHAVIDPRWAALAQRLDKTEVSNAPLSQE